MTKERWAAFGKWVFASAAAALFFYGVACLLGRVDGVKRPAGIVLILLVGSVARYNFITASVSVQSVGDYARRVTLSASGQPSDVTVNFSPTSVIYDIRFREFPIEGAYVVIRVREGGIVEDFALIWRRFEKENESIPVITPEEAFERLRSGEIIGRPLSSIQKVAIENIELGYYLVPPIDLSKQDYLIPVYLFHSAFIDLEGSEGNWTFIVLATIKPEQ